MCDAIGAAGSHTSKYAAQYVVHMLREVICSDSQHTFTVPKTPCKV